MACYRVTFTFTFTINLTDLKLRKALSVAVLVEPYLENVCSDVHRSWCDVAVCCYAGGQGGRMTGIDEWDI